MNTSKLLTTEFLVRVIGAVYIEIADIIFGDALSVRPASELVCSAVVRLRRRRLRRHGDYRRRENATRELAVASETDVVNGYITLVTTSTHT